MPAAKNALKAHRALCEQLNWQIRQREGWIRNNCSFFCFVGPADTFRSALQHKPLAEIPKPAPSYEVSPRDTANTTPLQSSSYTSMDGNGASMAVSDSGLLYNHGIRS